MNAKEYEHRMPLGTSLNRLRLLRSGLSIWQLFIMELTRRDSCLRNEADNYKMMMAG